MEDYRDLAHEMREYAQNLYRDAEVTEELIEEHQPFGERLLGLAAAQKSCASEIQDILEGCGEDVGVVESMDRG